MSRLSQVLRLERSHIRSSFSSGAPELDDYLTRYAWQNQRAHNATTYVVLNEASVVVAYYSITVAGLARDSVPLDIAKGSPQQVGCLLLARLAVTSELQGSGVGRALLADVLRRAADLAAAAGMKLLLIHCRDDAAKSFYLRHAEFVESPTDPMHLVLPMKDLTQRYR